MVRKRISIFFDCNPLQTAAVNGTRRDVKINLYRNNIYARECAHTHSEVEYYYIIEKLCGQRHAVILFP